MMNTSTFALSSSSSSSSLGGGTSSSSPRRIKSYQHHLNLRRHLYHIQQQQKHHQQQQQQQQQQQNQIQNQHHQHQHQNDNDDNSLNNNNKKLNHLENQIDDDKMMSSSATGNFSGGGGGGGSISKSAKSTNAGGSLHHNKSSSQRSRSLSTHSINQSKYQQQQQQNIKFRTNPIQYLSYRIIDLIHKAFEKEEKVDELETMINEICGGQEFIYRKQHEIDVLCEKTSFTKKEIKLLYWGWKLSCPDGILNEFIFKEIYSQFFPQAGDSSLYAHYVFQAMFLDSLTKNEPITFLEYAKALSTLCRGTILDKIKWIFLLYDINHDGRITYDEVYKMSVAIYLLLGFHVKPPHNIRTYEEHAKKVFNRLDQYSLGYVTFDQFKDICLQNETILSSMQQLDTNSI